MSLKVELLQKHIRDWKAKLAADPQRAEKDKLQWQPANQGGKDRG